MQKNLRIKNLKFFVGLQDYEESNSVPDDKFYRVQNARFAGKVVSSKKGYQALGNMLTGGTKWRGLYEYPHLASNVTTKKLLGIYNKIVREFNTTTQVWDTIPTTWPNVADLDTDGIVYNNVLYMINPMEAASPGIGKVTNSTFAVVPASPRGFAIESWVERLWAIGDPTAPNTVIASRAALASAPANIEDWVTDTIIEIVGKGGRNVALRVLNNELFVFKEDSIYYNTVDRFLNGQTNFVELSRTGGALNQKSTIIVENDIWFMNNKLEIRSLGTERNLGTDPRTKDLSEVIKRTMMLLDPVQDNPVMSYNKRVVKLHLKTIGSPTNNLTIIFDYNTGGFSVDRGQGVTVNTIWRSDLVYGEDASGQVFKDETGYTANGAQYVFGADTPFMDDSRPDTSKRARYIYFRGQQSYNQPVTIRLYRDGDYSVYSTYTIPSPQAQGMTLITPSNDGQWGSAQQGAAQWGGDSVDSGTDITMYRTEYLISVDRRSNMYAFGLDATINNGKVIAEQLILKVIDDNENYKRADL